MKWLNTSRVASCRIAVRNQVQVDIADSCLLVVPAACYKAGGASISSLVARVLGGCAAPCGEELTPAAQQPLSDHFEVT